MTLGHFYAFAVAIFALIFAVKGAVLIAVCLLILSKLCLIHETLKEFIEELNKPQD